MADHETSGGMHHDTGQDSITLALSFIAGGGLTAMIVALTLGALDPNLESFVGLMFMVGLAGLAAGSVGWIGYTRPFDHIDDINVGTYTGHEHDHHDDDVAHDDVESEGAAEEVVKADAH